MGRPTQNQCSTNSKAMYTNGVSPFGVGAGNGENVGDDRDSSWMSARAVASKNSLATVGSGRYYQVLAALNARQRR